MIFAERPTCHDADPYLQHPFMTPAPVWRESAPQFPYRSCSYCGSIHFEDLIKAIDAGARLSGADWKYGWPHKFYVQGGGISHAKVYTEHLLDVGADAEALDKISAYLHEHAGIKFEVTSDGKLRYTAPFHGYQRM